MQQQQVIAAIDAALAADKTIAGQPEWQPGPRDGQVRWQAPLDAGGELTGLELVVDAYPRWDDLQFTILVISNITQRAVVKLEYSQVAAHMNNPPVPPGVPEYLIQGPHCHHWEDNKEVFSRTTLQINTSCARYLPDNVQGFENAFRWLCGYYRIDCGRYVPDYPTSDVMV